jgi:hypothetical protein
VSSLERKLEQLKLRVSTRDVLRKKMYDAIDEFGLKGWKVDLAMGQLNHAIDTMSDSQADKILEILRA